MRFLCVGLILLFAAVSEASTLAKFQLIDVENNKQMGLDSLVGSSDLLIVISQGAGCPLFKRYIPTIHRLKKKIEGKKITLVLVNSFANSQAADVKKEASMLNLELPVYIDVGQKLAKEYGIKSLSESMLLDLRGLKVLYRGSIDDKVAHDYINTKSGTDYLEDAIASFEKGQEIKVKETKSKGCLIQFK